MLGNQMFDGNCFITNGATMYNKRRRKKIKANNKSHTKLTVLSCAPSYLEYSNTNNSIKCSFDQLSTIKIANLHVEYSSKCHLRKGALVSEYIKKGFHILWLDYHENLYIDIKNIQHWRANLSLCRMLDTLAKSQESFQNYARRQMKWRQ